MAISVKIGELKNHLSGYLKKVRKGGEVVISDRDTPVGRIVPFTRKQKDEWQVIDPPKGYQGLSRLSFSPSKAKISAVETLLKERRSR